MTFIHYYLFCKCNVNCLYASLTLNNSFFLCIAIYIWKKNQIPIKKNTYKKTTPLPQQTNKQNKRTSIYRLNGPHGKRKFNQSAIYSILKVDTCFQIKLYTGNQVIHTFQCFERFKEFLKFSQQLSFQNIVLGKNAIHFCFVLSLIKQQRLV